MKSWINDNTPISVIVRCFKANKKLQILVPTALVVTGVSAYLNSRASKYFDTTLSLYTNGNIVEGFSLYKQALVSVSLHYLSTSIAEFVSKASGLFIFQAFLCESTFKYIDSDYTDFHSKGSAKIQDNVNRSSKSAREVFIITTYEIPKAIIEFFFAFMLIRSLIDTKYFIIFNGLFCFSIVFCFYIAMFAFKKDRRNHYLYKKSFTPLSDILHNFDVMKAFNKESAELQLYRNSLDPFMESVKLYLVHVNSLLFLQKLMLFLPHIYVFYCASTGINIWRDEQTGLKIIIFYNSQFSMLKKSTITLRDRIFSLIKECSELKTDLKFAGQESKEVGLLEKKGFESQICVDSVDLYAGNALVQKAQSFVINKGDKVAITGTNGAGKSVFMKTLLKFFKNEGKLYIDDVLIENISTKALRDLISYVPQDPHIFNSTVIYNLGYSQKIRNEQAIYERCEEYGLHEFFKSLRNGYHTEVGERGKYLSGGQKQRISIMRALIKDAPIIIMDEPTASIDKVSEYELINKVINICKDKTFILIVHNHELLKIFNKILHFSKDGITCFDSSEQFENRNQ
ncbi:1132 ABC-type multidrug transport system [Glugoides intestinalis]